MYRGVLRFPFPQRMTNEEITKELPINHSIASLLNDRYEEMAGCYKAVNIKLTFIRNPLDPNATVNLENGESFIVVDEEMAEAIVTFDIEYVGTAKGCE